MSAPRRSIRTMSVPEFPPALVDLQKRSDAAWAAVEQHRKQVDESRLTDPRVEHPKFGPQVRGWYAEEDAEHGRLLAAAREAAEGLRAGVLAAGLTADYATTQGLKDAARA